MPRSAREIAWVADDVPQKLDFEDRLGLISIVNRHIVLLMQYGGTIMTALPLNAQQSVNTLAALGDPIEKDGCALYNLGHSFPQYAEFWAKYVVRNRDPQNPSKLTPDIPSELQDLFNSQYAVWYHFTLTYRQLGALPNYYLSSGDPLFHFGTAIELIEMTVLRVLLLEKAATSPSSFDERLIAQALNDTRARKQAITDNTKNAHKQLKKRLKNFQEIGAKPIRRYRDLLTHRPPLLERQLPDNKIGLPKPQYLKKYENSRWSTDAADAKANEFQEARSLIKKLGNTLIKHTNSLWRQLLIVMQSVEHSPMYKKWLLDNNAGQSTQVCNPVGSKPLDNASNSSGAPGTILWQPLTDNPGTSISGTFSTLRGDDQD